MKKVFMIHGFMGEPNGGWRPWLMSELAQNDIWACALPMPTPDNPIKDEWIQTIKDAVKIPTDEIFLIGHSLGVPAILHYLESLPDGVKIGGAVLVSGPVFKIPNNKYDLVNKFLENSFNFDYIKKTCNNFVIIQGDDDPNVPITDAEYLSKNLSCNLILVPNGKHLNGSAGIYKLPQALESLLKMIGNQ